MKIHSLGLIGIGLLASCDQMPVTAPPGNYDLEATSVTAAPKEIFVGNGVVFSKIITNKGQDPIPGRSYKVDLYVDQELVSFDHATSRIEPGLTVDYGMAAGHHHWKPTAPGVYKYRFIVDEENRLKETDENNNVISGVLTVKENPKGGSDPGE